MDIRIVSTIGTEEPVTLNEVKNYLRINNTQDDALITSIVINARMRAERYLNSDIVAKQRRIFITSTDAPINLPYAPIASIDTVIADEDTLVEDQGYFVEGLDNPLIEVLAYSDNFNSTYGRLYTYEREAYVRNLDITYTTAGLDFNLIKQGVLTLCAELYYGRNEKHQTNWRAFLSPFKIFGYYGTR